MKCSRRVRDIHRNGSSQTNAWSRKLRGGKTQQGSYDIVCDGIEHSVAGQPTACRMTTPSITEGYVKTPGRKPSIVYSVSVVAGDVLTVRSFGDAAHTQLVATLVYDRVPL